MADTERICEHCHKSYTADVDVCPDDGGRLIAVGGAQDRVGTIIDGKFTLTEVLGEGGMGVVYRARQHSMDREVAVKFLHPSFSNDADAVRRFLHEAKAASRLNHPNVITVFDFGQTPNKDLYLVMEILNGNELYEEMRGEPLPPDRVVHILTQACDAVHHAHEEGLVHRDLKPENIFLLHGTRRSRDFVKVLDFGIAMMRSYEGAERITKTGAVCGTPGYIAPEQVLGDLPDRRADVYALGVMAFEMLTGKLPFEADTPMRQMLAHLKTRPPTFEETNPGLGLPAALEQVVMRALAKRPASRQSTALALADQIVAAVEGRPIDEVFQEEEPIVAIPVDDGRRGTDALLPTLQMGSGLRGIPELDDIELGDIELGVDAIIAIPVAEDDGRSVTGHEQTMAGRTPTTGDHKPRATEEHLAPGRHANTGEHPPTGELEEPKRALWPWLALAVIGGTVAFVALDKGPEPQQPAAAETAQAAPDPAKKAEPSESPESAEPEPAAPTPAPEAPRDLNMVVSVAAADAPAQRVAESEYAASDRRKVIDLYVAAPVVEAPVARSPIRISSEPPGADVWVGDIVKGKTPMTLPRPDGDARLAVVLKRKGYKDADLSLGADSADVSETLVKKRKGSGRKFGGLR